MKKAVDILLVMAVLVLLGAVADLIGLTQIAPKGFGVTPGGYLKLAQVLAIIAIALILKERK